MTEVEWSKFLTYKNVGEEGESFKPSGLFAGWADYLVVPSRQATACYIQFFGGSSCSVHAGQYRLELVARIRSGQKRSITSSAEVNFEITTKAADGLNDGRGNSALGRASSTVHFLAHKS